MEFRTIEPSERDVVLDLLADWLGDRAFFARYFRYDPTFRDDLCFVAVDGQRVVSTLQVFRKAVRVDGAVLAVGGVGNVYTDPAYRAAGVATALLERAIAEMQAQEFDVSLLFASRIDFYARLGWVPRLRYLSFIEPRAGAPGSFAPTLFEPARDLDRVMAVYDAYSAPLAGATVRDAPYWAGQLRYAGNPDERFVVAHRGADVVAYARGTRLYEFNTILEHGCVPGAESSLADLIVALHAEAPTGTLAQLEPAGGLAGALADRGLEVKQVEDRSWMWRVIRPDFMADKLGVSESAVQRPELFETMFPAARSRYWLADRF